MKSSFIKKTLVAILVVTVASSCQGLFHDDLIKSSPNAVSDLDIPTLMSGTLVGTALLHEDTDVRIAYMWSGQLTGESRQHQQYAQYQVTAQIFSFAYPYNVGLQARLIQSKADAIGDMRSKGIAQVIEALVMAKQACLYGDIPYSQAFNADKYPTPVYDKQADVYSALQTTLDDAISNLSSPTGIDLSNGDFYFFGDPVKWTAVANTLKARLYLHLQDYNSAIKYASLGISNTSGDMLTPHGTSQGIDINLNYDFFNLSRPGDCGFDAPAFLPTFLKSRNENAMYDWFFAMQAGSLQGNPDGFFAENAFQPVVTYYENQLILAESYARLGNNLQAGLDALNAVRASLNSNGYINGNNATGVPGNYPSYTLTDFGSGGVANSKNFPTTQTALIYEIIAQKYVVTLSQYESFNDVRRCAIAQPLVQIGITPIVTTPTGTIGERFIYPQTEINVNPNTPKVNGSVADQFTKVPIFQ